MSTRSRFPFIGQNREPEPNRGTVVIGFGQPKSGNWDPVTINQPILVCTGLSGLSNQFF
jgi:hypothetical protein